MAETSTAPAPAAPPRAPAKYQWRLLMGGHQGADPDNPKKTKDYKQGDIIDTDEDLGRENGPGMSPKFERVYTDPRYLGPQTLPPEKKAVSALVGTTAGKVAAALPALERSSLKDITDWCAQEELVEVIRGAKTKDDTLKALRAFAESGK